MINNPTEEDITNLFTLWPIPSYHKLYQEYINSKKESGIKKDLVLTSEEILEFLKSDSKLFRLYRSYCLFIMETRLYKLHNKILSIRARETLMKSVDEKVVREYKLKFVKLIKTHADDPKVYFEEYCKLLTEIDELGISFPIECEPTIDELKKASEEWNKKSPEEKNEWFKEQFPD